MAWSASVSFSISTKANPRERPVSRSVMIRALLTAPYRSNKLRTASSVALKLRLPTKIFFTSLPPDNLKAGSSGRQLKGSDRGPSPPTLSQIRRSYQTRSEYITEMEWGEAVRDGQGWRKNKKQGNGGLHVKKPSIAGGLYDLNRATSYSPTQLPVQYHRG